MNDLPSSVESYLLEVGFSATEILVLRKLLENDALTIRELGTKTGKGPGVLDQAIKKLARKGIIAKKFVNDAPKYTLHSLDVVQKWVTEDMREKREMLLRKQRDFESFIATIARSKDQPEMEHFEGEEGIKQAYMKLLEKGGELLQYFPVTYKEEEDPLRSFRVQLFRERRRRGIFARILAHDVSLARRFQSRDIFEYRKTMLIAPEVYPFVFEQIIAEDTIACFDHEKQKACFVHFPQFAESQRLLFESIWRAAEQGRKPTPEELTSPTAPDPQPPVIPFSTRTLSTLRTFFLSRRSLAVMSLLALLAGAITFSSFDPQADTISQLVKESFQPFLSFIFLFFGFLFIRLVAFNRPLFQDLLQAFHIRSFATLSILAASLSAIVTYGLYRHSLNLNFQRMQEQVKAVAATGAFQFDPRDLDALQVEEDWKKPEWEKVVKQLINIRENNRDIVFAYILRKAKSDPTKLEFVADSHSLNPYAQIDLNSDGVFDEADELNWPGQVYEEAAGKAFDAYEIPIAEDRFYSDQWGIFLSAYAPIREHSGTPIAILGIDMKAEKLGEFTRNNFRWFFYFIIFFTLFLFVEIAALNPALLKHILFVTAQRNVSRIFLLISFFLFAATFGLYFYTVKMMEREVGVRLMSIAAAAAPRFAANDLDALRDKSDMRRPEYQKVFHRLNEIRNSNRDIKFVYIFRSTPQDGIWEFVADADSNYNLPIVGKDHNDDDILNEADENLWPGVDYDIARQSPKMWKEGLVHPMYEVNVSDQWGVFISGAAPIFDQFGNAFAVLGIDTDIHNLRRIILQDFEVVFYLSSILIAIGAIPAISIIFKRQIRST